MKKSIILLSALALFGCKKCYQCTTTYTQSSNSSTYPSASSTTTSEICGTPQEIEDAEKVGTYSSTANSGNVVITTTTTTDCK